MTSGPRPPRRPARADVPAEPLQRPPNKWVLLRGDLLVLVLAAIGLLINWWRPYELSDVMMVGFGVAIVWVGYRMWLKNQAYDRAE